MNKTGPTLSECHELYDFVVDEFKKLEKLEPHRIMAMRIALENKKEAALNFASVLDEKFEHISQQFSLPADTVVKAMDSTERTSSMVENLNGRVRTYIRNRKMIEQGYLDLLRFFLNHKPIVRSARADRKGKTPAEILSGKPHPHWLELLGFGRFKRAA